MRRKSACCQIRTRWQSASWCCRNRCASGHRITGKGRRCFQTRGPPTLFEMRRALRENKQRDHRAETCRECDGGTAGSAHRRQIRPNRRVCERVGVMRTRARSGARIGSCMRGGHTGGRHKSREVIRGQGSGLRDAGQRSVSAGQERARRADVLLLQSGVQGELREAYGEVRSKIRVNRGGRLAAHDGSRE